MHSVMFKTYPTKPIFASVMKTTILSVWTLVVCLLAVACQYTLKIRDGRTAYERRQYHVAIPMLKKEYAKAKLRVEKGQLAFQLADSYRRSGQDEPALEWFKKAHDNNYGSEALKGYAFTLKKLERYPEAQESFKALGIEIGSPYEYRKEVNNCKIAADWRKKAPGAGWVVDLTAFNSPQNDFAPAYYTDGQLVFTSDRAMSQGDNRYNWTGNKFMDLFVVGAEGASPQLFDAGLNSTGHEGTICFNTAGTEAFWVRAVGAYKGDDAFCKIYSTRRAAGDGGWDNPQPLAFQQEKVNYLHPALSPDGNVLYFSCNSPDGWGGYDLYAAVRNTKKENGWDDPKILSRNLNTTGNELFPSFDGDTLYFASDGLPGMGGLDVFRTYRMDRNNWAPPLNLKAPFNSGADDFGFIVDATKSVSPQRPNRNGWKTGDLVRAGFFTSNRTGGRGGDDIYRFEQRVPPPPPPPPKIDTTVKTPAIVYKLLLEGFVVEKIYATADNPNSAVLGRRPLPGAKVSIDAGGKKQTITVGDDGQFKLELAEQTDYNFVANKAAYLVNGTRFSTKGIAKDPANPVQTFEVEIVLDKIFRDREIVLENIYYDYDKWDIRPDAEPTLNRLADVLRQNPDIRISLGSHTDCRGNDGYNQTLSQRRAESAVAYLIGQGISAERLNAVGYGEAQPTADCLCARCTENEHQTNRRTTFKIVE